MLVLLLRQRDLVHLLHVDLAHSLVAWPFRPGIDLSTPLDEPGGGRSLRRKGECPRSSASSEGGWVDSSPVAEGGE